LPPDPYSLNSAVVSLHPLLAGGGRFLGLDITGFHGKVRIDAPPLLEVASDEV
jgi:hypothetical protein